MEDENVEKEEPMSEEEETEGDQEMFEVVAIKQEELIGDEEEIENSVRVKDEVVGYPMIKQVVESTEDPLGDGSGVLQESIGVQKLSEAGPSRDDPIHSLIADEHVEEEVGISIAVEDGVTDQKIKQNILVGDGDVKEEVGSGGKVEDEVGGHQVEGIKHTEEVGNSERDEDDVAGYPMIKEEALIGDDHVDVEVTNSSSGREVGYPMIKREVESTEDPLGDGSDILQESIGVQKLSEAGPSIKGDDPIHSLIEDEHVEEEVGISIAVGNEVADITIKQEALRVEDSREKSEIVEDEVGGHPVIKQEVLIRDEQIREEVGISRRVKDEVAGYPMINEEALIRDEQIREEVGISRRVKDEVAVYPMIKEEALIRDEQIEEEVGISRRVKDEVAGYPMIKEEALIRDEEIEEEVGISRRVKDEVAGYTMIKEEALIRDEQIEEEVGISRRVKDEVPGYPMIKEEALIRDVHVDVEVTNDSSGEEVGYLMIKREVE
ncbi:hypothetical protein GE061_004014 [Apolygus lucorum]|uniref:Uncharacterized protein n=1 Tax=Apolygus lucorum TaxID=248454 RepID=A0A8S9WZU5_APOLU|nr:hypothetical protein GE061_004014 [Apolygus lucorum]